jgi:membrane fusion protein (multidrug efflux system)
LLKRSIIVGVLLVLLVGGLIGFNLFRQRMIGQFFANQPVPVVTVSATEAAVTGWTPVVDTIGTLNALHGVDLTVQTSGIVMEISFTASQKVRQGAVLLRLDDAVQAADLQAAQTQAELDQTTLERARSLGRTGINTQAELDAAAAAASASQAQVEKRQAVLDQKRLQAPFDGTIGIPQVDVGQYLTPGTVVATLQDLDTLQVNFTVPQQELPLLEIGQPVSASLPDRGLTLQGRLSGIDPKFDLLSRVASVKAELDNIDNQLVPGQFVTLQVLLPEETNVVSLPQTAVVSSLYGDYVYVATPPEEEPAGYAGPADALEISAAEASVSREQAESSAIDTDSVNAAADASAPPALVARQVFVTSGRRSGGRVEIVRGLEGGEQVIDAGQNRLNNGVPVTVDNSVRPAVSGLDEAMAVDRIAIDAGTAPGGQDGSVQ